jgi:hypothetical protein
MQRWQRKTIGIVLLATCAIGILAAAWIVPPAAHLAYARGFGAFALGSHPVVDADLDVWSWPFGIAFVAGIVLLDDELWID